MCEHKGLIPASPLEPWLGPTSGEGRSVRTPHKPQSAVSPSFLGTFRSGWSCSMPSNGLSRHPFTPPAWDTGKKGAPRDAGDYAPRVPGLLPRDSSVENPPPHAKTLGGSQEEVPSQIGGESCGERNAHSLGVYSNSLGLGEGPGDGGVQPQKLLEERLSKRLKPAKEGRMGRRGWKRERKDKEQAVRKSRERKSFADGRAMHN